MSKRGLGHIEFIISFVIFTGFILFAFVFFNPLQSQRTIKSSLDYAWIEIVEETKETVETYSISLSEEALRGEEIAIEIEGVLIETNVSVENVDGQIINYYKSGKFVNFNPDNQDFFRVSYSTAYLNDGPPIFGQEITSDLYSISSSDTKEVYFENLFLELNKSYFSDYNSLKQKINLPNRIDFGFSVKFGDSSINSINSIPDGLEVLSKVDRIEIVRKDGRKEYADLRVMVW